MPRRFGDEELALLAAIHAEPRDDTVRLAYADWLEENGQPDCAEFIRLQVMLHTADKPPRGSKTREKNLLRQIGPYWRGLGKGCRRHLSGAFPDGFTRGLPNTLLFVSTARTPGVTLGNAVLRRDPRHQFRVIVDIEADGSADIRPVLRHSLFSIAHEVEVRETVGHAADGTPHLAPITLDHVRQAMECLRDRPYRLICLREVSEADWDEAIKLRRQSKAERVHLW